MFTKIPSASPSPSSYNLLSFLLSKIKLNKKSPPHTPHVVHVGMQACWPVQAHMEVTG